MVNLLRCFVFPNCSIRYRTFTSGKEHFKIRICYIENGHYQEDELEGVKRAGRFDPKSTGPPEMLQNEGKTATGQDPPIQR
jgi:hypothetical protein